MASKTEALSDEQIAAILRKPYSWVVTPDESGRFFAKVAEFPGCIAEGATEKEAMDNLHEVATEWVRASASSGYSIPEPPTEERYSGKFLVRTLRSIHRKLMERAEQEGVSFNQLVSGILAEGIGIRSTAKTPAQAVVDLALGKPRTAEPAVSTVRIFEATISKLREQVATTLIEQERGWTLVDPVITVPPAARKTRSHRRATTDA
jgi:antitoxin HicB